MNALYVLACAVVIGTVGCEGAPGRVPGTVRGEATKEPCIPFCNQNHWYVQKLCPRQCVCTPRGDASYTHRCISLMEGANMMVNSGYYIDDDGAIRPIEDYNYED